MEEAGLLFICKPRVFFVGMTVNSIMFIIFQCTSKKKLQALIGQWQKKAFGKWHSHVKKKIKKNCHRGASVVFLQYRKLPPISPSPIYRPIDL